MYWKVDEYEDDEGIVYIIMNYFHVVTTINQKPPFYNSRTKSTTFFPQKQVIIRSGMFSSHGDFLNWYVLNKNI